jgi:hypothetical protein
MIKSYLIEAKSKESMRDRRCRSSVGRHIHRGTNRPLDPDGSCDRILI